MNNKFLLVAVSLLVLGAGALVLVGIERGTGDPEPQQRQAQLSASTPASTPASRPAKPPKVPAYQTVSEARNLPPTLPAAEFFGKTRDAYKVAREIPQTLAQLPCYCHCDQSFGHKSLHTCFVDDHAAHCAVCVDEALMAYRLQREEKLTPEQVRDRVIEKFGKEHRH